MGQSGHLTTDPLQDNKGLNSGNWGGGGEGFEGGRFFMESGYIIPSKLHSHTTWSQRVGCSCKN